MDTLFQDLRFAARVLARQPGFALTAVLCLAIGIGANATMFGVVDALLLRPPPHVADADRLVRFYRAGSMPGVGEFTSGTFAYPDLAAIAAAEGAYESVAAFSRGPLTLGQGAGASQVEATWASHTLFPLLGVRPELGRFFTAEEDRVGSPARVAVLSLELWQAEFGGDPAVVGRDIRLGGDPFTVVGVAPAGFTGADLERVDVWVPVTTARNDFMGIDVFRSRGMVWLNLVGRLRPGTGAEAAAARADAAFRGMLAAEAHGERDTRLLAGPVLRARGPDASRDVGVSLWVAGVSLIVLLVACINVANLLLTRGVHRRREIAVRLALGVSRARLVRQLLAESVLIALLGAAGALLVVVWGGGAIRLLLVPEIPSLGGALDARMLGFTAAIATLTGVLCGLAPALRASRPDLNEALRGGARAGGETRSTLRSGLQVGQVALTLVLLVGAGLFVRSLLNVRGADLGLEPDRVLMVAIDLRRAEFPEARVPELFERMRERVAALPGVADASIAAATPFRFSFGQNVLLPGRDSVPPPETGGPYVNAVTDDFFRTMGLDLRRGRGFGPADRAGAAPVAVVNETMARWLWPDGDAVGRCFREMRDGPCIEVVGLLEDSRRSSMVEEPQAQYFLPLEQSTNLPVMRTLLVRADDPEALAGPVRGALQTLSPDLPYLEVVTLREVLAPQLRPWRLGAAMFGIFGLLALALAMVGLYGVLAFQVSQRTREIGIRLALGARGADVVRLFVGRGVRLVGAGVAIGCAAAWLGARALSPQLFGVSGTDPATFAGVVLLLTGTAVAACYLPARRATRVDPMAAMRAD